MREFIIDIPDSDLDDLRHRLAQTRWPEPATVDDWSQGVPLGYLRELCGYWRDGYDWRAREARLNEFPQFITDIDGLPIHFIHVRSRHDDALPLVITHGWPGSVVEFCKVIEPLTDPVAHGGQADDAFHLVCPSLPGYAFSGKPSRPGWGTARTADAWDALMTGLGYHRYGAQGGDWGAQVTTGLAMRHPGHLVGIHLNMPIVIPDPATMNDLTEAEQAALASLEHYSKQDSGYAKQQSTRPQTLGYGLLDSPAGLCAWIIEKFWSWTDSDGDPANVLTRDEMLDNVMLYWLPGTGASAARMYWESLSKPLLGPVEVPVGCSIFPKEIIRSSRRWAEKQFADLRYWNEPAKGGHFAAFEQPATFVDEVRAAFRAFR
ncbi:MAG TPA: epoxide hydrolase [Streptosporangiaceae bacterium]|nr:epoxide hydrolase [Streptosporangiaceae bacterium]